MAFKKPLDLMGLSAFPAEEVKALRRRPVLALDVRQCQLMGVVDCFEAGPLLLAFTKSSSEPDERLLHKALFGGRPLPRPAEGYAVLEAREVARLAPLLKALSLRKLRQRLDAMEDHVPVEQLQVELAVESVQDCARYFREHAKKGNALLQWNAKWKGGPSYRPDEVLAVITGRAPRRLAALIQAFNRYTQRKGLRERQQLTPDEALSALLGSKRRREYLGMDFEVIPWLRPHLEVVG